MNITPRTNERTEVDVSEWNEDVKAFIRPLNGFETLLMNDYFLTFYDKELDEELRFKAAFNAAKTALVGEDGAPILTEDDEQAVRDGSFLPLVRFFTAYVSSQKIGSTSKKN